MTERVRHPAAGCTKRQREVFEQSAIGQDGGHPPTTLEALAARALIERVGSREIRDGFMGIIRVPVYEIPVNLHMQWCEWTAQQPDEDDDSAC